MIPKEWAVAPWWAVKVLQGVPQEAIYKYIKKKSSMSNYVLSLKLVKKYVQLHIY